MLITAGAKQLRCFDGSTSVGNKILPSGSGTSSWLDYYNRGGLTTCSARIGVLNYVIITRFFSWSAKGQEVTGGAFGRIGLKHNTKWAHADYKDADALNHILMPEQYLAVLTDPWALNHLEEIDPNKYGFQTSTMHAGTAVEGRAEKASGKGRYNRLLNRTNTYYDYYGNRSSSGDSAFSAVNDFFDQAKDNFLSDEAKTDGFGDDVETAPVLYKNEKTRKATGRDAKGHASGWDDPRISSINRPNSYPTNW